ncbi:MAG: NADH dehydrogenase subunit [Ruminococcaceae bacterium]|nr:NADH dehydrogenase subunit [Oscillospiraceae bacterium]
MSYIVPIGPYHPALEEPIHTKLYTEGEVIKDAEVYVGYNHRGIEKLAEEKNVIQTLVLVERVCGICSHSHAFTYALAVEKINQVEVPKRGEYMRVITAELERLHSHLLWAGIACHIIGHDSLFMHIWDVREVIMDMLESLSGNRVNYGMVTIGGARRDVSDDMRREFLANLKACVPIVDRIVEICLNDKTIAMRTQGVGVMKTEDALRLGAVGPHARASNVDIDIRRDSPYSAYADFEFKVPVWPSCDVFARVVVRALECYESVGILIQALENLPEGPINTGGRKLPKIMEGACVTRHEAPRGQLSYKVVGNGSLTNHRVSIHVPSYKNTPTVPFMLRDNTISDAGLIIASIDPCFSCLDR